MTYDWTILHGGWPPKHVTGTAADLAPYIPLGVGFILVQWARGWISYRAVNVEVTELSEPGEYGGRYRIDLKLFDGHHEDYYEVDGLQDIGWVLQEFVKGAP